MEAQEHRHFSPSLKCLLLRRRYGRPKRFEEAEFFHIKFTEIAQFISRNIDVFKFNIPENFLAISLWSCYGGATHPRSLGETMSSQLIRALLHVGIYSRIQWLTDNHDI